MNEDPQVALLANLTATQERCNALLEEARAARLEVETWKRKYKSMEMVAEIACSELRAAHDVICSLVPEVGN